MQISIDKGDSLDYMVEFFLSVLFIAPANSGIMTAQMLNIMAIHPYWQETIYEEIRAAAAAHGTNTSKDASLLDQLDSMPLEAWETAFPMIELCLKETIRMWTSFNMGRLNSSPDPIPIPGTDEVIPGNTFVVYNSTEVNFSEKLYPNPYNFDPERFLEGREEFKRESHSCESLFLPLLTFMCSPAPCNFYLNVSTTMANLHFLTSHWLGPRPPSMRGDTHGQGPAEHRHSVRPGYVQVGELR